MKENIVIFGSNGQLGSDICHTLNSTYDIHHVTREMVDVESKKSVLDFFDNMKLLKEQSGVKAIINCIAFTNVDGNETNIDKAFRINTLFVSELVSFCKNQDVMLIHFSTDYVFDGRKENYKYKETDLTNPLNMYGLSKYNADNIIMNYLTKYFIFRVSSLFGANHATGKQGSGFIPTMIRLAQEKESWNVISDQISCPTHTLDVARVVDYVLTHNIYRFGLYNCVSSNSCSWFDFAKLILREYGYDDNKIKPISYKEYKFIAQRPQYSVLDISKLLEFYSMPSYEDAFLEYKLINATKSK